MKFDLFAKKNFKCDTCEKKFKTAAQLEEHRQLKHKKT
ncbi:MAG TPA: C2H2-type zinc finger protein [Nitrososphaeraceae archaeon]|nr:C2H2-type zinc finger protein [Nitrososphaeraceae archaeon]HEX2231231.1 C2H2-type zinc finger protein [Nitrososphaeraceae archaeon]HKG41692.1 C2H2-type zinc finger protein [Nitrososphaeraceae archaeon]